MTGKIEAARRYRAVVFKHSPCTEDFTCSEAVTLPGRHTEQEAWCALHAAFADPSVIGGEVRPASASTDTQPAR